MLRRLFKTGNSVVISLPREMLDGLGLKDGDDVSIMMESEKRQLIISPAEKMLAEAGVDAEFSHQVAEFIQEYRPALEELSS